MALGEGQPATPPLGGFTLALLRAFAQAAQYGPAHPQAGQAALQAWEALGAATGRRHAVTLRQVGSAASSDFEITRHPEPSRDLASLLPRTHRDRMLAQLREVLAEACVRRLTLLPACAREPFRTALTTLVEAAPGAESSPAATLARLLDAGTHQVLAVGEPTLGRERALPRAVSEHLEILRAVVRALADPRPGARPLAPHALAETGAALVGLLPDVEDVRQLLASVDLAVDSLEPTRKRRVMDALVRGLARHRAEEVLDRCDRLVDSRGGPSQLAGARDERGVPLMGYFIAAQALRERVEAPPTRPRPHAVARPAATSRAGRAVAEPETSGDEPPSIHPRAAEWLAGYEALGPSLLKRLDAPDDDHLVGAATILGHVGARLLADRRYAQVPPILRGLKAARRLAADRSDRVSEGLAGAVERVLHPGWTPRLLADYPGADTATREALFELLAARGRVAAPGLARLLVARAGDAPIRREIAALLEDVGTEAGPALTTAFEAHRDRWSQALPLVRLLGAVAYRPAESLLADLLGHAEVQVRSEALFALFHMLGDRADGYLLDALDDVRPEVRQRAISLLAVARCTDPRYLRTLHELVVRQDGGEGLTVSAIHALQRLGNVTLPDGPDAETLLSGMLEGSVGSGLLRLVARAPTTRSTGTLGAVCEALAELGGRRARTALDQATRTAPPAVQDQARAALARLSGAGRARLSH